MENTVTSETLDPREDEELFYIKVEVGLTRAQLREYLGWAVVEKSPTKADLATIKRLIRETVRAHIVTTASELGSNWDLIASQEQVLLVDGALLRVASDAKPISA